MSESELSEEKQSLPEAVSIPKKVRPSKNTYLQARIDYETGNYGDMKELASKHGLNYASLREKASRECWKPFKLTVSNKISQKVVERVENRVELLLNHLEKKGIYYEKLVEASQAQASRNSEGIPELEPVDLEKYARVEGIAIEWRKNALGINDKQPISVDVNLNITAVMEKLRERESEYQSLDVESEVLECQKLLEGMKDST